MLEVRNLKTYFFTRHGVVKAVDGINFRVGDGENLGLVGESGCGKSVTALSILRLVPSPPGRILEGEILLDGEDILKKSEAMMRKIRGVKISIILQDPLTSLNPAYTIGDQIGEAVEIHQHLRGKLVFRKVVEVLKLVRVPEPEVRAGDYPHQMSGGMRQRVAGAIALSCQPRLLIADEPTTSLDVTIQAQYLDLLKQIQEQSGISIVFVTHDFGIVARMCDHVAVMYAGKIVEFSRVKEIFDNPCHPYTTALLKCLPRLDIASKLV
ncbi:ABC transporter ATP-binding protein, partial [Patescibacteria group bacterium]|nr:ABC transporter ATP-binding protein [Patescibacteria group bacterium]